MHIDVTKTAQKQLSKLPRDIADRIVKKMYWYSLQDDPLSFAKQLTNAKMGEYRFRIGSYRVLCDVSKNTVQLLIVLTIKKRDHIYD